MSAETSQADEDYAPDGLGSRLAALDVLKSAVARRGGLEDALARPSFTSLPPRERSFARALVGAVLRRLGPLDMALDERLERPPPEAARWILRAGAAQLLYMKVAPHAAISTSV